MGEQGAAVYFFQKGDRRVGPATLREVGGLVATHGIDSDWLVWTAGMPGWSRVADADELRCMAHLVPPPVGAVVSPAAVSALETAPATSSSLVTESSHEPPPIPAAACDPPPIPPAARVAARPKVREIVRLDVYLLFVLLVLAGVGMLITREHESLVKHLVPWVVVCVFGLGVPIGALLVLMVRSRALWRVWFATMACLGLVLIQVVNSDEVRKEEDRKAAVAAAAAAAQKIVVVPSRIMPTPTAAVEPQPVHPPLSTRTWVEVTPPPTPAAVTPSQPQDRASQSSSAPSAGAAATPAEPRRPVVVQPEVDRAAQEAAERAEREAERLARLAEEREDQAKEEEEDAEAADRAAALAAESAERYEGQAEGETIEGIRNMAKKFASEARKEQAEHERDAAMHRRTAAQLRGDYEAARAQAAEAQRAAQAASQAERQRTAAMSSNSSIQNELNRQTQRLLGGGAAGDHPGTGAGRAEPNEEAASGEPKAGKATYVEFQPGQPEEVVQHDVPPMPRVLEFPGKGGAGDAGAGTEPSGYVYTYFPDGRPKTKYWMRGKVKDGDYEIYSLFDNHYMLEESGEYKNNLQEGVRRIYYRENGQDYLQREWRYSGGVRHGKSTSWGTDAFCGWKVYKTSEGEYVRGERHGREVQYTFDCKVKRERITGDGTYSHDKLDGVWTTYDDQGLVKRTQMYSNGQLMSTTEYK